MCRTWDSMLITCYLIFENLPSSRSSYEIIRGVSESNKDPCLEMPEQSLSLYKHVK